MDKNHISGEFDSDQILILNSIICSSAKETICASIKGKICNALMEFMDNAPSHLFEIFADLLDKVENCSNQEILSMFYLFPLDPNTGFPEENVIESKPEKKIDAPMQKRFPSSSGVVVSMAPVRSNSRAKEILEGIVRSDYDCHSTDFQTNSIKIPCDKCDGTYMLREGEHGPFTGCSNFPHCRSTKSIPELVLKFIDRYGIRVYRWNKLCYRCKKQTPVYSYYLDYELSVIEGWSDFSFPIVGLGDLAYVDHLLSERYSCVKKMYSNTTKSSYIANSCIHCKALQGRNYVVEDPHEIISELWHNHQMERFLVDTIFIPDIKLLYDDIKELYTQE